MTEKSANKMVNLHVLMAEVQLLAKLQLLLFFSHVFHMGSKIINI